MGLLNQVYVTNHLMSQADLLNAGSDGIIFDSIANLLSIFDI